jgi:hypothetical protein
VLENDSDEFEKDLEKDLIVGQVDQLDFELLKLKDEYAKIKLFSTDHDEKSRAELATLRFKIRMIEAGIKTND